MLIFNIFVLIYIETPRHKINWTFWTFVTKVSKIMVCSHEQRGRNSTNILQTSVG